MIRKYAGEMELVCDTCGQESASYDDDNECFEQMILDVKNAGWSITRQNGQWSHCCTSCASEESILSAARRKFGLR